MSPASRRLALQRALALVLLLGVVPALVTMATASAGQPFREGEPAPRTVYADAPLREVDTAATETARRQAAESVEPVLVVDPAIQTAIIAGVRAVFEDVRAARQPPSGETARPSREEQMAAIALEHDDLDDSVIESLTRLLDGELEVVERETIAIAQQVARQRVTADQVGTMLDEVVPVELALRPLPRDAASVIVPAVLRAKMRPTVTIDLDATAAARQREAEAVPEVARVWRVNQAIVREGELVDALQLRAIERLGISGTSALRAWLRASAAMLLVTAISAILLQRMLSSVSRTGKKLVLLGILVVAYAALVVAAAVVTQATSPGWYYTVPAGALGMLTALLIHPVVGIATMLPASMLVLLVSPASAPAALFAAAAVLVSVPLTTRIATRSDLRKATVRAGLSYPVLVALIVAVFGPRDQLVAALAAAAVNGLLTALAVQGALPFLETLFRLPTVTALLDLADRNHPLLRQLEAKALGTYNHSVMVAQLAEQVCRTIGADPLLGRAAALYHDIGKIRQPHYFIENQQGIANPHDELDPVVSAIIIRNHIVDGVELATEHRLPPEVVDCIGSHHGTMRVSYFYEKALTEAAAGGSPVDVDQFRHKGPRPRSKEAAVVMLADCCEATTRAMAMTRGTIPREEIASTVDRLLEERVEDGQFDESDLTFRELSIARDTIIEALVGIYHPRIAYPPRSDAGGAKPVEATSSAS